MRNARAAAIDNAPVVIASTHDIWLCHDGTGTTLTNENSDGILGDITINGTTAGIWANAGNFTPAGDHTNQFNGGVFNVQQALGDLTNPAIGNKQIIFFVDFNVANNPSGGQETILCYGIAGGGSPSNAMRMTFETTGRIQLTVVDSDGASTNINSSTTVDVCDGTDRSALFFVDFENGVGSCYVDGVLDGSTGTLDTDSPVSNSSTGWSFFANFTSAAPSYNNGLGSRSSGAYINRLGIIRPSGDVSAKIGDIALGLSEVKHELPRVLHGV